MIKRILLLSIFPLLSLPLLGQVIAIYNLPEGNSILQLTGADAIDTVGGMAVSDTRTLYYLDSDFGDPQPNTHDWTFNTAWPYVFVSGSLDIDTSITATITTFDDGDPGTGDVLLIDGNPVYQFVNDTSPTDANGNFGPWYFIEPDGTATQSTVPEPSAIAFGMGLIALAIACRRSRMKRA